ncbi:MAG TPA: HD domain-containing protein [Bellilinea sp.]|nr:HD domain-containing protein [Bellilinea sp.]
MVHVDLIDNIRPAIENEFSPGVFIPRTEAIARAYDLGKALHKGQLRMSGEPYFETHCVWVAGLLDRLIGNEAWTIAGLLHDAIEDQGEDLEEIRRAFPGPLGEEVAYIVDGVTKISNPRDGRSRELETLRKIAQFRNPGVFLVKLADKSHNLLTLEHMPEAKRKQKANEAIRAYGKLAGILNCYRWRRWIEDLAFPHADPETYQFVRSKIDADPRVDPGFINPLMQQLADVMDESGIEGRVELVVNGYWQVWQKLRRMARAHKSSMNNFRNINDLVSFRMVVNSKDALQCYRILPKLNRFLGSYLDQNSFDDYIACPQNNYRALQTTAWMPDAGAIEVAIATEQMEGENHWGVVYALQHGLDVSIYSPIEILTPSGGARFLPEGSTVLDAVASIQQDFLLDKISSVKVNDRLTKLSEHVRPGDVVEVITGGTRLTPTEDWLNFANDSTKRILRGVLIVDALKKASEIGKKMLQPILAPRGIITLDDIRVLEPDKFDNLLELVSSSSMDDLHAAVGSEALRIIDLEASLDAAGITAENLKWSSIQIWATNKSNKPGVLATLAQIISQVRGNILRSINNTQPDGGFYLRIVIENLTPEAKKDLIDAYKNSGIEMSSLEVV